MNTIFKDLATLVHEQGEVIDSIEANVESTHVRVQEGTEQLRQAETYKVQKKISLNSIFALLLIYSIFVAILLPHYHSALLYLPPFLPFNLLLFFVLFVE